MKLPSYQDLSKEQDKINNLPLDKNHIVMGPPGTGKTVTALYRSKMLHDEGTKVLLLMYSRLLSQYTAAATGQLEIDGVVKTFHQWFYGFYLQTYGIKPPQISEYSYDWDQVLKTISSKPPKASSLQSLIIDEGQDLSKQFFILAKYLAKTLVVFCDENQRLVEDNSTLEEIKTAMSIKKEHVLTRNYRNSREIAALAAEFYTGLPSGIPEEPTRSGTRPVIMRHRNINETAEYISRYEKNHSDRQIGVFVHSNDYRSKFLNRLKGRTANPIQTYVGGLGRQAQTVDFDAPGVFVINYPSAKGLEFDTVFLPELQAADPDFGRPETRMRFYVLLSRAREELFLVYSGDGSPRWLSCLPKELLDWR